jgi:hypothetical protein
MGQHECMTAESKKIQYCSSFFRVGDSPHEVLHLIANHPLRSAAKKDDKQEDDARS